MPFNGSGTYTLPGAALVTGGTVDATEHNTFRNDVATALTDCVTRDGQSPATANLPMGGFKLTGLAAGTANGNSIRFEQVLDSANGNVLPYMPQGTGAVSTTVQAELRQYVSVFDFMTAAQIADVEARTLLIDVSAAVAAAMANAASTVHKKLYFPPGSYKITSQIVGTQTAPGQIDGLTLEGAGKYSTILKFTGAGGLSFNGTTVTIFGMEVCRMTLQGDATTTSVTLKGQTIAYGSGGTAAAHGLTLNSVNESSFRDLRIVGFGGHGILLQREVASCIFDSIYLLQNSVCGVCSEENPVAGQAVTDHNHFTRVDSNQNGAAGFLFNNANNQIFDTCKAVGNGLGTAYSYAGTPTKRGAWVMYGSYKTALRDCYFEASGEQHVYFGTSITGSVSSYPSRGNIIDGGYFVGTSSLLLDTLVDIDCWIDSSAEQNRFINCFHSKCFYDLGTGTQYIEGYNSASAYQAMMGTTPKNWEFRQLNSLVAVGQWAVGMRVYRQNPVSGTTVGWVCTTGGTFTAIATTGSITINTPTLTVASAANMKLGDFITIAGVTGVKRIKWIAGTTITLDSNADATVVGAAVANSAPTMTVF